MQQDSSTQPYSRKTVAATTRMLTTYNPKKLSQTHLESDMAKTRSGTLLLFSFLPSFVASTLGDLTTISRRHVAAPPSPSMQRGPPDTTTAYPNGTPQNKNSEVHSIEGAKNQDFSVSPAGFCRDPLRHLARTPSPNQGRYNFMHTFHADE